MLLPSLDSPSPEAGALWVSAMSSLVRSSDVIRHSSFQPKVKHGGLRSPWTCGTTQTVHREHCRLLSKAEHMLKPLLLLDCPSYRRRLRLRHLPLALAPASARQRRSKDLLGRLCQPLSLSNWRSRSRRLQHWGFPTIAAGHCLKAWHHRDAKERTACLRPCAGEWRRPDAAESHQSYDV